MDEALKKKLLLVFEYLKLNGCHYAEKEGDFYNMSFYDQNNQWYCVSQKSRGELRLPIDIVDDIEELIDKNQKDFDGFGEDPYGFEARLYPDTKKISVFELYSEYRTEDTQTVIVDSEEEPEVKEIIDHYCEKEEICRGNITFQFHGGGDSGYIEDGGNSDFDGETKLYGPAEDMFYRMLRDFPGWEINEGSQGQCIIDMDLEQLQLDFNLNYEEQKVYEIWSTSLMEGINEEEEKSNIDHTSSVEKLLDLLYFNGLDVNYSVKNYMTQHHGEVYDIDLDIDVSRFFYGSPNYDENYSSVMYDIENMFDKVEKYLGIKNGSIVAGLNYVNSDFLDDEALKASKELQKTLMDRYGFTKEESTNYYLNIYYNDDNPNVELEALANYVDTDNKEEIIKNEVMEVVDKSPILNKFDDIQWWINY